MLNNFGHLFKSITSQYYYTIKIIKIFFILLFYFLICQIIIFSLVFLYVNICLNCQYTCRLMVPPSNSSIRNILISDSTFFLIIPEVEKQDVCGWFLTVATPIVSFTLLLLVFIKIMQIRKYNTVHKAYLKNCALTDIIKYNLNTAIFNQATHKVTLDSKENHNLQLYNYKLTFPFVEIYYLKHHHILSKFIIKIYD